MDNFVEFLMEFSKKNLLKDNYIIKKNELVNNDNDITEKDNLIQVHKKAIEILQKQQNEELLLSAFIKDLEIKNEFPEYIPVKYNNFFIVYNHFQYYEILYRTGFQSMLNKQEFDSFFKFKMNLNYNKSYRSRKNNSFEKKCIKYPFLLSIFLLQKLSEMNSNAKNKFTRVAFLESYK